jgi:hypothetical protein
MVCTGSDPDFQDGPASMRLELRNGPDKRFHGIPMPLDLGKPLAAQFRQLAYDIVVGTAGAPVPIAPDILVQG